MLSKAEISANINNEWEISSDYLKESRYGLCRFIIDLCQSIQVSGEVASLAMLITNYFFVKKCYFNYEKLTLACAATLLASKKENAQNKFNEISKGYYQYNHKIFPNQSSVFTSEENQKIKDKISIYEIELLKALQFNIKIALPYDFIYVYSYVLYPDNESDIISISASIGHDSFFTYANNVYKNYVVAIACIIIAAKFVDIPTVLDNDFKGLNNLRRLNRKGISEEEFERKLINFGNIPVDSKESNGDNATEKEDEYFNKLSIAEKIHPKMNLQELLECIEMIMEFYIDAKKKAIQLPISNNK